MTKYTTLLFFLFLAFYSCKQNPASEKTPTRLEIDVPTESPEQTDELPESVRDKFPMVEGSKQLVLVSANSSDATVGQITTFEKQEGSWTKMDEGISINLGKAGFAPDGEKREGDKKTPSGLFLLGPAFGYDKTPETEMEFIKLDELHHWMSDSDSANYNQLIHYIPGTPEMEKMKREDALYSYGLVVQYNMEPATPEYGSAIFLHVERGPGKPTLGCISMPQDRILDLIEWLDPTAYPVILMGTPEYLN